MSVHARARWPSARFSFESLSLCRSVRSSEVLCERIPAPFDAKDLLNEVARCLPFGAPEPVQEEGQHLLAVSLVRSHEGSPVMVDNDREVPVALLVARLVLYLCA